MAGDLSGSSVSSAGDVNGDGFDDVIVGASGADPNGDDSGASYVVFGKTDGFAADLDLSTLDGTNGFKINGEAAGDGGGVSVSSAGDVNGDGFGDLVVGATGADPNGLGSGANYVVFGKAGGFAANLDLSTLDGNSGFAANLDLSTLDGNNGFQISGEAAGDLSGGSVSSAGDFNGDGFDDLIIGAHRADPNGNNSGASYVVFGKAGGFAANANLSTLNGKNGFQINGEVAGDLSGSSVSSAGDVNGDGFDDLIIGGHRADSNGYNSGASYVVFGKAGGFTANFELSILDGSNGFQINGEANNDHSGISVSSAGDVNGDGFDDVIVGAHGADLHGDFSGASYVVFGKTGGFGANLDLATLDGNNGFQINGEAAGDFSGRSVSAAGDVNGDGFDDLIVGANGADPQGDGSGASYVIFGHRALTAVTITGTDIAQTSNGGYGDDAIIGFGGNDRLFGWEGADFLSGGDDRDLLLGGTGSDILRGNSGDDVVCGGRDNDILSGGAGNDVFRYSLVRDGSDRINDFQGAGAVGGDVINLRPIDAVAGGLDDTFLFGGSTATAHGIWYALLGGRAMLYADTDGNTATAELTIALVGVTALTAGDFIL